MKIKLIIIMVIFSFLFIINKDTIYAKITYLNNRPIKYSRVNFKAKQKYVNKKIYKKAKKFHKLLLKSKKKKIYLKGNNPNRIRAIVSILFGKYCSYIRSFDIYETIIESDDNSKFLHKIKKKKHKKRKNKYSVKFIPKEYRKARKRNRFIRNNVLLAKSNIKINFMETEFNAMLKINQFVCDYVEYDYSKKQRHNAYYGFKDHLVLCMGYADMCCILLNEFGIKAGIIGSKDHEWNWVVFNNKENQLDSCWNDTARDFRWLYNTTGSFLDHDKVTDKDEKHNIKIKKRVFK